MPPWAESSLYQPPTVAGLNKLVDLCPTPNLFRGVQDIQQRWNAALIMVAAFGIHEDGTHLDNITDFHPHTVDHYRTGKTVPKPSSKGEKIKNWRGRLDFIESIHSSIHDLITLLDRLTGGISVFLHHPGAHDPTASTDVHNLRAHAYMNPRFLHRHPYSHVHVAELVQLFVEHFAYPNVTDFNEARHAKGWGSMASGSKEPHPIPTNLPLVPSPASPHATELIFQGRVPGSLAEALADPDCPPVTHIPTPTPGQTEFLRWKLTPLPLGLNDMLSSYGAPPSPEFIRIDLEEVSRPSLDKGKGVQRAAPEFEEATTSAHPLRCSSPAGRTISSAPSSPLPHISRSDIPSHVAPAHAPANASPGQAGPSHGQFAMIPPTPTPSTLDELMGSLNIVDRSALISFGEHTEAMVTRHGLSDTVHPECWRCLANFLPYKWEGAPCKGFKNLSQTTHVRRLLGLPRKSRRNCLTPSQQALVNATRATKRLSLDHDVCNVLEYLDNTATDLAIKHRRSRRFFLERFYMGSTLRRRRTRKTSAWSAFTFFRAREENIALISSDKSDLAQVIRQAHDYGGLTTEQRELVRDEFARIKRAAQKGKTSYITPRARAAEANASFSAIVDELTGLKHRLNTHALVILVRGSLDFTMQPKVFTTDEAVDKFITVNFRKDPMELGGKLEGVMVNATKKSNYSKEGYRAQVKMCTANIRSSITSALILVTHDASAGMSYSRYEENVVRRYNVKLVGWEHEDWRNPGVLRGGKAALERLADAVEQGRCHFVEIDDTEVEERRQKILAGVSLTPNCDFDPTSPWTPTNSLAPPSTSPPLAQPDASSEAEAAQPDDTSSDAQTDSPVHTAPGSAPETAPSASDAARSSAAPSTSLKRPAAAQAESATPAKRPRISKRKKKDNVARS
ncbi:hypothetical protein CONPUDRAFT_70641 [Coniophora puteana RWD-64-598 SS2]|uniref:Uncharacterized protein n=1 Tax=Coniophora puteana (strain RWD-64-598) TaxID=741705 RepID=A0A5M3MYI7_CONPW|nr:uncharacterized protein CONPUDRAFT_70641 [Coniophora puteana RWD-64-598 SS2]EIW83671.1 hypothetical protein CONPUDRAFT_70641 [Coniophora puteana RWD-64-598 SS2]